MDHPMPSVVTVNVLVAKSLDIDEPEWCVGHTNDRADFKPDITHLGPQYTLDFRGKTLWSVMLGQSPFASVARARTVGMYVEQGNFTGTLDPAGLDALAAAMVEHAIELEARARELAALIAGGEGQ